MLRLALVLSVVFSLPAFAQSAETLWPTTITPTVITESDPNAVELGVVFSSDAAGQVTGISFYKGPKNVGTHYGHLWTAAGALLATVTFTHETASGWQTALFSTPVQIAAGATYLASYHDPKGHYSDTVPYFTKPYVSSDLTVPVAGGVYKYCGNVGCFPNQSWNDSNYYVTPIFFRGGAGGQSLSSVSLSGNSFTGGAASGTVVGAVSVGMSPASPAFSGSLSLSGTDAASFQMVGSNLETNGVVPVGTYNINVVATQSGVMGSPFTQPETITGTSTGASCPQGTTYPDGCPGAPTPAATIQDPNILNTYGANRPPWNVAGVDYYVGKPNDGVPLTDWRTIQTDPNWSSCTGTCWRYNGTDTLVMDHYDFTKGTDGWSIYTSSAAGITITNSVIGCNGPSAAWSGINSQSSPFVFVFKNNTVDYSGCAHVAGDGLVGMGGLGCSNCSMDFEYNYIHDEFDDPFGISGTITGVTYKYNLIDGVGISSSATGTGVHMNSLSFLGGPSYSNVVVAYNTVFVSSNSFTGGEFMQFYFNAGGTANAPVLSNNTFPFSACGCVSYDIHGNGGYSPTTTLVGGGTNSQNYFDITGNGGSNPYYPSSMDGWTSTGNINMVTGATITPP